MVNFIRASGQLVMPNRQTLDMVIAAGEDRSGKAAHHPGDRVDRPANRFAGVRTLRADGGGNCGG
jgi:hypothetical protein